MVNPSNGCTEINLKSINQSIKRDSSINQYMGTEINQSIGKQISVSSWQWQIPVFRDLSETAILLEKVGEAVSEV